MWFTTGVLTVTVVLLGVSVSPLPDCPERLGWLFLFLGFQPPLALTQAVGKRIARRCLGETRTPASSGEPTAAGWAVDGTASALATSWWLAVVWGVTAPLLFFWCVYRAYPRFVARAGLGRTAKEQSAHPTCVAPAPLAWQTAAQGANGRLGRDRQRTF